MRRGSLASNAATRRSITVGREIGPAEVVPPGLDARADVLEQMAQAALAAGQVVQHVRPHDRPAQPRPVGDRGVDVLDAGHTLERQVDRLAIERHLHAVGDVAQHLAADRDRPLADRAVEGRGPLEHRPRGRAAADQLDQRHQVRRVERVCHQVALGPDPAGLQVARQQAGRARGDDRIAAQPLLHAREQGLLGGEVLGPALLDEGRASRGRGRVGMKAQALGIGPLGEAQPDHRRPGAGDEVAHLALDVRRRIVDRDLEAVRQEQGRPAGADRAGADHRDPLDRLGWIVRHGQRRYSTLPSTPIAWPETSRPASEQR